MYELPDIEVRTRSTRELLDVNSELELERDQLRDQLDDMTDSRNKLLRDNEQMRGEIYELNRISANRQRATAKLVDERDQLRAELARVKPAWKTAPKWANFLDLDYSVGGGAFVWWWKEQAEVGGRVTSAMVIYVNDTLEARPDEV
jgi:predicted nuclease with TOPRIM domain